MEAQAVRGAPTGRLHRGVSPIFFSGATIFQMSGICHAMLELQIWRKLCRSAPYRSAGVTSCFVESGGGAGTCSWKGCCSGICWLRGCIWKGGGTRLVLIPCRCIIMESVRSMLVRVVMPCRGSIIAALNQSRNGATYWVIPTESSFACFICYAIDGARKGETISRWNRKRGAR